MKSVKRKGSVENSNTITSSGGNSSIGADLDPLSIFAKEKEQQEQQQQLAKEKENESNMDEEENDDNNTPVYGMYDVPSIEDYFSLLSGERTLMKLPDLLIQYSPGRLIPGTLFMTTYRMAFLPPRAHLASLAALNPSIYSLLNVPLSSIEKIEREKKDAKNLGRTIIVSCKDIRQLKIFLQAKNSDPTCTDVALLSDSEIERALSAMCAFAFPNDVRLVFANFHTFPPPGVPSLPPYDPMEEFRRLGVLDVNIVGGINWWRVTTINDKYRLCSSYSRVLVVPSKVTDEELFSVANFRSGGRFPILSWLSKDNGASIWRSSQPKSGVSGSCIQDENYLDIIAHSAVSKISPRGLVKTSGTPMLYILDCRPKTSAMANRAAGAGYETSANYPNTKLDFMNIGNIHVMRDSLRQLSALFTYPGNVLGSDVHFGKQIEETGWLTHVRLVLKCSWECARSVQKGVPVLVHCSHGWDRTSQVVSLAQIMLDPYYRTFDGFRVLIEKEWLHAGHPFQIRCGHSFDKANLAKEDDLSPIFLQFLDCVYQLVHQYPHYFEFNTRYLLVIADNIFSCRFGNFLYNCEADRDQECARTRCPDLFTYLHYNRSTLCSPHYMDPLAEDTPTTLIFLPALSKILRNVCLWKEYFNRWSAIPTTVTPPESVLSHLNIDGIFRPPPYRQPQYDIDEDIRLKVSASHDFDIPAMSTSQDAWEAMYYVERSIREKHEARVIINGASPPSSPIPCEEEIRSSFRNSLTAKEEDILISEPFVAPEEVIPAMYSPALEVCLDTSVTNFSYEAVIPTEPTSPRTVDDVTQIENVRQQQIIHTLTSFLQEKGYDVNEILANNDKKSMSNPLFEEDD